MKNKLHKNNIPCHPEQSEGSHPIVYVLYSILLILFSIPTTAQTYNWQWAMKGGGNNGGIDTEQIHDIKVGSDGNYYFIATIEGNSNTQLNGQPQTVYNSASGTDIFLFSTTCDGTVRWSQTIGGSGIDFAFNLVLDDQNNIYIGGNLRNDIMPTDGSSVHFSPNNSVNYPNLNTPQLAQEELRTAYLVKYDSNGTFIKKEALQGAVSISNFYSHVLDLAIDSSNNLHFIIGLGEGTHLDSNVTVPNTVVGYHYYLAKYDSDLDYISDMQLPVANGTGFPGYGTSGVSKFAYDEALNRYYIAGERNPSVSLTYDGSTIVNKSFLLAINSSNGHEIWRRELYSNPLNNQLANNRFTSLKIDTNSDVYIGGNLFIQPNDQNVKFYDPTDTSVQPYLFTPGADYTIPMIARLNSSGTVQWVQATEDYSVGAPAPGPRRAKGIAINGSEVALATQGANEFWDTIEIVRPLTGFQPDPVLIRFNKQTGNVIAVHEIYGDSGSNQSMTALATDNDGNYITGGTFQANLFMNNTLGITPLVSTGQADFFVAKLVATPCGTPVSTDKFNKLNVNVYPNPTNDIVNIETQETLFNYVVYDVNGREIQKVMFGSSNQLNLQNANSGVYFVKVTTTQGSTATVKVIKK